VSGNPSDYLAFGLRARSTIDIPGAIRTAEGAADLTIGCDAVTLPEGGATLPPYTLAGDGFVFEMPDLARYHHDAGTITVDPLPGADSEMVAAMLIATMLPATIWARGGFMLHAAAAIPPGGTHAVAIAGPSGSGKSTLLARMVADGWTVVAEDSVSLDEDAGGVFAAGLPGIVWRSDGDDRSQRTAMPVPSAQQAARAPLAAILYIEAGGTGDTPEIVELPAIKAIEALLANRHRPGLPFLMRIEGKTLPVAASLSRRLTIRRLTGGDPARIALQPLAALASPDW
jgi:hypothetical protein